MQFIVNKFRSSTQFIYMCHLSCYYGSGICINTRNMGLQCSISSNVNQVFGKGNVYKKISPNLQIVNKAVTNCGQKVFDKCTYYSFLDGH